MCYDKVMVAGKSVFGDLDQSYDVSMRLKREYFADSTGENTCWWHIVDNLFKKVSDPCRDQLKNSIWSEIYDYRA